MKLIKKIKETTVSIENRLEDTAGKVGVPILLYFLGVPGGVVILLWVFFFRGK